jgi:hypothetical protein
VSEHKAREANGTRKPTPPKLFLATPAYGCQVTTFYVDALARTISSLTKSGIYWTLHLMGNESLITRARNRLVAAFLKTDCTHLIFLDADVGWEVQALADMVISPHEIVCGCYPMKGFNWPAIAEAAKAGARPEDLLERGACFALNWRAEDLASGEVKSNDGFVQVKDGATGFMVIKRSAILKMIEAYGSETSYLANHKGAEGETHFALFDCIIDDERHYLSEDYAFCRRWQKIGGEIYIYLGAKLTHTGTHTWQGDVSKVFDMVRPTEKTALDLDIVPTDGGSSPTPSSLH